MQVTRIDFLVLNVADIEQAIIFYESVRGMKRIEIEGQSCEARP